MSLILELYPWLSNPALVISQAFSGLNTAILTMLVALGISMIFGTARIINLAHGSFYMLGAYCMSTLAPLKEDSLWFLLSSIISALIVGCVAGLFEGLLLRRIYKKGAHLQIMMTFGMLLCINSAVELIWGTEYRNVDRPESMSESVSIGLVNLPKYNLFLVVVGIGLLLGLWLLIRKTSWGRNVRASALDREMLSALGVNINRLSTQVFILASVLAGLAGALAAPLFAVSLQLGFESSLSAFIVVVIGGLGSLTGCLWAALLVGQSQAFSVLIAPKLTGFIPSIVMLVALVWRYGKASYVYGTERSSTEDGT